MPSEMRFCRACGFRLGEGVAEFTETVRFDRAPTASAQPTATSDAPPLRSAASKLNFPGGLHDWSPLVTNIQHSTAKIAAKFTERQERKQQRRKEKRHRSHWMGWLILTIVVSVASSGGFLGASGFRGLRLSLRGIGSSTGASRSWVGTSDFKTGNGGVTFDKVEPQGSPADQAGLVGGDLITSFDGQPVKSVSELMKLLTATPVGKTVDVVYVRDGETKTVKLTTISKDEMQRLEESADQRTEGYIGEGTDLDRVQVPGTSIYGVQLNDIRENNPAEIAGLRDGDIVIEFNGIPTRTRAELESRIVRAEPGSTVKVILMRGAERVEIPVKIGHD
jgi:C-terminal processing protease CtpA/Prc